jgi:phosphoglycerol transferase MdoB-like AlkP superfamily enzyme
MVALLAVGGLALVLAAILLFKDWTAKRGTPWRGWVLAGFFTAVLVWLGRLIALAASVHWLARNAHYIAAGGDSPGPPDHVRPSPGRCLRLAR